jgi:hypothetical protein
MTGSARAAYKHIQRCGLVSTYVDELYHWVVTQSNQTLQLSSRVNMVESRMLVLAVMSFYSGRDLPAEVEVRRVTVLFYTFYGS